MPKPKCGQCGKEYIEECNCYEKKAERYTCDQCGMNYLKGHQCQKAEPKSIAEGVHESIEECKRLKKAEPDPTNLSSKESLSKEPKCPICALKDCKCYEKCTKLDKYTLEEYKEAYQNLIIENALNMEKLAKIQEHIEYKLGEAKYQQKLILQEITIRKKKRLTPEQGYYLVKYTNEIQIFTELREILKGGSQ